jgi:hypothetical protein
MQNSFWSTFQSAVIAAVIISLVAAFLVADIAAIIAAIIAAVVAADCRAVGADHYADDIVADFASYREAHGAADFSCRGQQRGESVPNALHQWLGRVLRGLDHLCDSASVPPQAE